MNDQPLAPSDYAMPTRPMSPWARDPHPVARAEAERLIDEVAALSAVDIEGLYGVLVVRDCSGSLRVLRAAPPVATQALGIATLTLPVDLPRFDGSVVARALVFPRGEPDDLDTCPTSRLFAHALSRGWDPLVGTEIWFDSHSADGLRRHRQCYPACRGRCRPLVRAMVGEAAFAEMEADAGQGPETARFDSVFEDEHVIVVDKPSGLLSVPGLSAVADVQTALQQAIGPKVMAAHRLDQATSGLLALAKTPGALRFLQRQFAERRVQKVYEAVLDGVLEEPGGVVALPLALDPLNRPRQRVCSAHGKASVSRWERLAVEDGRTRVAFYPDTGRTHQLRVHAAHRAGLGIPIVGDELYGQAAARLCLHARDLTLPQLHDREPLHLHAAVPF